MHLSNFKKAKQVLRQFSKSIPYKDTACKMGKSKDGLLQKNTKKMKKGGRFFCDTKYKSISNQGSTQTIQ